MLLLQVDRSSGSLSTGDSLTGTLISRYFTSGLRFLVSGFLLKRNRGTNETQDPLMAVFNTLSLEVSCSRDEATSLSSPSRPLKKYKLKKDLTSLSFRTHIFIGREHNLYCKCISVLCDHMKGRPNLMKDFSDYHSIKEERFPNSFYTKTQHNDALSLEIYKELSRQVRNTLLFFSCGIKVSC